MLCLYESESDSVRELVLARAGVLRISCSGGLRELLVSDLIRRVCMHHRMRVVGIWEDVPGAAELNVRPAELSRGDADVHVGENAVRTGVSDGSVRKSVPGADANGRRNTLETDIRDQGAGGDAGVDGLRGRAVQSTPRGNASDGRTDGDALGTGDPGERAGGDASPVRAPHGRSGEDTLAVGVGGNAGTVRVAVGRTACASHYGLDPLALRYALLTRHYRTDVSLGRQDLEEASAELTTLRRTVATWAQAQGRPISQAYVDDALSALDDDLDTAAVLPLFARLEEDTGVHDGAKFETAVKLDMILGLDLVALVGRL